MYSEKTNLQYSHYREDTVKILNCLHIQIVPRFVTTSNYWEYENYFYQEYMQKHFGNILSFNIYVENINNIYSTT